MLHLAVNINDEGLVLLEVAFESILVPVWYSDMEILFATVENEVVVIILFLLLFCF